MTTTPSAGEPSDEMIDAYLKANDTYWITTDNAPHRDPSAWRNGTVKEATRVSLRAALAALTPPTLTDAQCDAIRAEERERCALICEGLAADDQTGYGVADDCANVIRAAAAGAKS